MHQEEIDIKSPWPIKMFLHNVASIDIYGMWVEKPSFFVTLNICQGERVALV